MSDRNKSICELYASSDEISMSDLANQFDISRQRVHQILQSNDVVTSGHSDSSQYDKKFIKNQLQKYYEKHNETPKSHEWQDNDLKPSSVTTIYNYYDSWTEAVKDAGLPTERLYSDCKYTDEEILDIISELHKNANGQLGQLDYQEIADQHDDLPHYQTIISRFGTWSDAIKESIKQNG